MSNFEPKEPYVYQPDGINSPDYPRIYALAGPGVPLKYQGKRYVKEDAESILNKLKEKSI